MFNLQHIFLFAVRTTSPISSTGIYRPSAPAPSWSSRVITLVILTGWATQRLPLCGTTTRYAPIGGVPTRPWKGVHRHRRCCRLPTGMNFSVENLRVKRPRGQRNGCWEEGCSQTSFQSAPWHALCDFTWTVFFFLRVGQSSFEVVKT